MNKEKINPETESPKEIKPIKRLTTYYQCETIHEAFDFIEKIDNVVATNVKMTEQKQWFVEVLSVVD